jgi:hypothetical protein
MKRNALAVRVGDRVRVLLDSSYWRGEGWLEGTVVRIDPYSAHSSFHWVELDTEIEAMQGGRTNLISVLNPRHIVKVPDGFPR